MKREYINNWKKSICSHSRLFRFPPSFPLLPSLSHPDWAIFYPTRRAAFLSLSLYTFPQPRKIYLYDFFQPAHNEKWAKYTENITQIFPIHQFSWCRGGKNAKSSVSIKILFSGNGGLRSLPRQKKKVMTFFGEISNLSFFSHAGMRKCMDCYRYRTMMYEFKRNVYRKRRKSSWKRMKNDLINIFSLSLGWVSIKGWTTKKKSKSFIKFSSFSCFFFREKYRRLHAPYSKRENIFINYS